MNYITHLYRTISTDCGLPSTEFKQIDYTKCINKIRAILYRYSIEYYEFYTQDGDIEYLTLHLDIRVPGLTDRRDNEYNWQIDRTSTVSDALYRADNDININKLQSALKDIESLEQYREFAVFVDLYNTTYWQPWLHDIVDFLDIDNDIVKHKGLLLVRIDSMIEYNQLNDYITLQLEEWNTNGYVVNNSLGNKSLIQLNNSISPLLFGCKSLSELYSKVECGTPLTVRFGKDPVKQYQYPQAYCEEGGYMLIRVTSFDELLNIQLKIFAAMNYRDNFNRIGLELYFNNEPEARNAADTLNSSVTETLDLFRPYRVVGSLSADNQKEIVTIVDAIKKRY